MTLQWDAPDVVDDVESYEVVWGAVSGGYDAKSPRIPSGSTSYSVSLPVGRWYFAARAIGVNGLTSAYSNEVVVELSCDGGSRRVPQAIGGLVWFRIIRGE